MSAEPEEIVRRRSRVGGRTVLIAVVAIAVVAVVLLYGAFAGWFGGGPITLVGAGATFPFPLISKWSSVYVNRTGVRVNYQAIGSGGGIAQITARTVDFAGSDAPLSPTERAAAPGLLHVPETIGAVTAAYNLPGISTGLNLTGPVLVEIFRGNVTMWSDPSIANLNSAVPLPAQAISVVHRSDGSGTTFVWTNYLHRANAGGWGTSLVGKSISWPVGSGQLGNSGVAAYIIQHSGAIGYVELAYTVQNSMTVAKVRNPAGSFILPSLNSTAAAAEGAAPSLPAPDADWSQVSILDAPGPDSYPISSFTYLLVYKELTVIGSSMTQTKAKALVDFLWWAVHDGQNYSADLVYVPLAQAVVDIDAFALQSIRYNGQPLR